MGIIKVVCGIIFNQEKVFICRRKKGKSQEGFWEFPGGKIENTETDENALKRELIEELEMDVDIISFVGKSIHDYGSFQIELRGYKCDLKHYAGKLTDHDKYIWTDVNELSNYDIAPADIPLINLID